MDIAGFLDALDVLAPADLAEDWDNVGLIVGRRTHVVRRVLVALDLRAEVLAEAHDTGADTVLVHHPPIFPSLAQVSDARVGSQLVLSAAESRIAVVAAHTNLDCTRGGLNDQMAVLLGLIGSVPLDPSAVDAGVGLGRVGACGAQRLADLVTRVSAVVAGPVTWVGDPSRQITRVACCTGSGGSLLERALAVAADVYVTSDLKYHDADRAEGLGLICLPHGRIEAVTLALWSPLLVAALEESGVTVSVTEVETDPWRLAPAPTL
jgi:dinuclear metal center YbgI/SA1388 family protein